MSSINLKSSFLSSVRQRGVSDPEGEQYPEVLAELADFLRPLPPTQWGLRDLERFLKLRMANLDSQARRRFALALGVLSEILERSRSTGAELIYVHESEPDRALETQECDVAYDRTIAAPGPGPFHRERTPPPTVPPEGVFRSRGSKSSARWPGVSRSSPSGVFGTISETDALLSGFNPNRKPSTNSLTKIQVEWNDGGRFLHVLWIGSISGDQMRAKLRLGLSLQRTYQSLNWLIDMRDARVMDQDDADWFAGWLKRVSKSGARRCAVVIPRHAISKLQLGRICGITGTFFLSTAQIDDLSIHFYDASAEAVIWLKQGEPSD